MRTLVPTFLLALLLPLNAHAKKDPLPPTFVVVRKLAPAAVIDRVQWSCLQNGMTIAQATPSSVTCARPMDGSFKSLLIRALITPSNATNPVYYYRLSAIRVGSSTTIATDIYMQYQNAFGQVTTLPITNRKEMQENYAGLLNMKTTWESRLAAHADDEQSAMEESNAEFASRNGMTNPTTATSDSAAPESGDPDYPVADNHPSAGAAKQALGQAGCNESFRIVGDSNGKTIFEAKCTAGGSLLVQCQGAACKPLQ